MRSTSIRNLLNQSRRVRSIGNAASAGRFFRSRKGVAAVLAMMFLVLFGSLSVAMAIASRGNITTAATHLHIMRAQSAAETGLSVAKSRLDEAAARFVISASEVDQEFGETLWSGDVDDLGTCEVLPATTGRVDADRPDNLLTALAQAHTLDQNILISMGASEPTIGAAPANITDDALSDSNWLFTPAVAIEDAQDGADSPLCFSITYAPMDDGTRIRAIVTGFDRAYTRAGQPISRTISQDFQMVKRVNHAIISPSKIMIGKNVMVDGDLGARYDDVNRSNGDPMIIRSDFRGLETSLDAKIDDFYASLAASDVDFDNRLRVGHPVEGAGIPPATTDYDGDGLQDDAFRDVTEDGYVDEFDIFIAHFDRNGDGKVTLAAAHTQGTPAEGMTPELTDVAGNVLDDDLLLLIDSGSPDRNRNGVYGWVDADHNGYWNSGETMLDWDTSNNSNADQVLGWRDGFVDRKDQYAKVKGKLSFKTTQAEWAAAQGNIQPTRLQGTIISGNATTVEYNVGDSELPNISGSIFSSDQTNLQTRADGVSFESQVASQLGTSEAGLLTYVESLADGVTQPRYLRLDPDNNNDSLPDNYTTAYFEKMPFNSPSYSDWYYRPVYENMVFKDVIIPIGNNGLFRNCTFVGVTYVRTSTTNTHVLWGEYGKLAWDNTASRPLPDPPRWVYGDVASETSYPPQLPASACPPNQVILMANPYLDQADLPGNQQAGVTGFTSLPQPLVIDGRRVTDTKTLSNNIRFHNCLFVGSIVSESPSGYTQQRNKIQFTGATKFVTSHPNYPSNADLNPDSEDVAAILKSSMMLPNYSVDIGTFNSPAEQDVSLQGAVIAGVLDVRGNTSINGALLLTYEPVYGEGPMRDAGGNAIGNPANFNATIGYFGPSDGDEESLDPTTLPVMNGRRVAGWDTDADGLADVPASQSQPAGSSIVYFNGYGRIQLKYNPNMTLPDGIMVPMSFDPVAATYRESHQ